MKRFSAAILLAALIGANSAYAQEGAWSNVRITSITVYTSEQFGPSGLMYVYFSEASAGAPACASSNPMVGVIDLTSAGGALAASLAQSIMQNGGMVSATGVGNCNFVPGIETLGSLRLLSPG